MVTLHALERAQERWEVPTPTAAEAAIREAVRCGCWGRGARQAALVRYGRRCCIVKDNRVLTVYVDPSPPGWRARRTGGRHAHA